MITIAIVSIFTIPILIGMLRPFSEDRIQHSLWSLLDNLVFIVGIFLSIYLTKKIFFVNNEDFFRQIYKLIPANITSFLYGKDILTYLVSIPLLLFIIILIMRIFTIPLFDHIIVPLSRRLRTTVNSMGKAGRWIIGGIWQIPRSLWLVIIFSLLLNFYAYYFSTPTLSKWINDSAPYQFIYKNTLYPVLNSNIAKQIPVLLNDSFKKATVDGVSNNSDYRKIKIIEYFNGVTLDEAIKSTAQIDNKAIKIVGKVTDNRGKAYLIYKWVSQNIQYDNDKAAKIAIDPSGISSGTIITFNSRKGVCFDYSCLYISMCRAVGLKVRLVTGLGYSGVSWGDHAWNQVYYPEKKKWINVDATFGSSGINYFDKPNFSVDYKDYNVQGEW